MKGGYAVVIAGFVAPLLRSPFRRSKRFHRKGRDNKSGSGRFGNRGLRFRKSKNRTSRRSRTSRIPNTNPIKRNIVVKEEIRAALVSRGKELTTLVGAGTKESKLRRRIESKLRWTRVPRMRGSEQRTNKFRMGRLNESPHPPFN